MLCPRPTPLNRRPTVQNLPTPHRARLPAKRVRSSATNWYSHSVASRPLGTCGAPIRGAASALILTLPGDQ